MNKSLSCFVFFFSYLKVFPGGERKEGQLPLLLTPGAAQVGVSDEYARLHAWTEMKGDVLRPVVTDVHREAEEGQEVNVVLTTGHWCLTTMWVLFKGIHLWGYMLTCPLMVMCSPGLSPSRILPL